MNGVLGWFARAAVTEHRKLSGFNDGNLLSSFWRLEAEIRILPLKVLGGESVQALLLAAHSSLGLPFTLCARLHFYG